ncbi:flagellar hook-length control protein FliK [Paenibacillus lycopersici]|uniref:Flagellar hook-length control protein FliK n=1 Tax=Paenibacillus lycopersici TaxID=2704462 RepID=A0A6C0FU70_9BACL|nr:flagellar hook-length control protein FliK [Paenibacillus lycopersici]QHT60698.1 flagellar hook-length control protein FliK [Paenibacillus lycopersici]
MQMPISSASPSAGPAPGTAASSTASVQGADSGSFNQAFAKSLAGAPAKDANAHAASDAAPSASGVSAMSALASLLGSDLSASDLLSAIESLLQKLGDTDAEDLAQATTESDLTEALRQLDMLLGALTGVPLLVQPAVVTGNSAAAEQDSSSAGDAQPANGELLTILAGGNAAAASNNASQAAESAVPNQAQAVVTEQDSSSAGDAQPANGELLAILAGGNAAAASNNAIQAAESAVPNQAQAVVADLEEINALKAGLQEALGDLRSLLQNQKGLSANKEQLTRISQRLTSIDRLVSGTGAESPSAASPASDAVSTEVVDSVRALQTPQTPQANAHLQRMAHRLLHVGVLGAVQKPENNGASAGEAEAVQVPAETADPNGQLAAVNADIQRQLATVSKPVIAQPVPVQQFASTIQGMVVKAFNVTTTNGVAQAQLTLYPEHLGQVNVNISVHNGTLTAQFLADTVTAKDMLENQMAQLRTALQSQGLQVDKLVVSQASVQPSPFQDRQGAQGQQQGSSKRNQSNEDAVDEIDFAADLEEWNAQQAAARELGLGRGIHTIA